MLGGDHFIIYYSIDCRKSFTVNSKGIAINYTTGLWGDVHWDPDTNVVCSGSLEYFFDYNDLGIVREMKHLYEIVTTNNSEKTYGLRVKLARALVT